MKIGYKKPPFKPTLALIEREMSKAMVASASRCVWSISPKVSDIRACYFYLECFVL
ncbi:hypothetical protein FORC54_4335 [Vibrio vulnificus]|nr:hypothetical protein FORC54_4335 [Vibrio vulnificus]